ncbi:MAG: PQQ-dependent sugar dehydrogenase [Halothiobacillaceae bacterium]
MRSLLCRLSTILILAALLLVLVSQLLRTAAAEPVVTVVSDALEHPWSLAFLPDGSALVTERPGRLRHLRRAPEGHWNLSPPIAGLPEIAARGQGGLLDVVPHPDFEANRLVYLSLAAPVDGGMTTRLVRGRLDQDRLLDVETLFTALPASNNTRHFGGRIAFDAAGFVYLSIGDRGKMERAQDLGDHAGSIIRLHDDGRIPGDNPFVDDPNARPEIFSYGNRNPQGMAIHPDTDAIWTHEHGPRGGDEINVIDSGRNYGWPVITLGIDYSGAPIGAGRTEAPGMEQPLHHWTPSIAPSGMAFYEGTVFPQWQGDLFVGALAGRHLVRLELDGERVVRETRMLEDRNERIRDVRVGPDGHLWLLTDSALGQILRLDPTP